jgi:hypothetical protein
VTKSERFFHQICWSLAIFRNDLISFSENDSSSEDEVVSERVGVPITLRFLYVIPGTTLAVLTNVGEPPYVFRLFVVAD